MIEALVSVGVAVVGLIFALYKTLHNKIDCAKRFFDDRKVDKHLFDEAMKDLIRTISSMQAQISKISDKTDRQGEMLAEIKAILDLMVDGKRGKN